MKQHIKETLTLSWPIIVGQLGTVLMGVADTLMVGKVGTEELAAAGFSSALFFIINIFPIGFFLVVSPMVSAEAVNDQKSNIGIIFHVLGKQALILSGLCMLVLGILYFCIPFMGQTPEVQKLSQSYFAIVWISTIPLMLFIAYKQITDGLGFTSISMYITLAGLSLNVILNAWLIYGWGPFPALGLDGAGIATSISRLAMAVAIAWIILRSNKFQDYKAPFQSYPEVFKSIWKIGIPSGFQFFYEVAAFCGAAVIVGWMGNAALAGHNIALNIASTTYMASSGLAAAAGIRVGTFLGEKNIQQMRKAALAGYYITGTLMLITCLSMILFSEIIVTWYNTDPEVIAIGSSLVIIAGFFQLSDGIQAVSLSVLRAVSDVQIPSYFTLAAYWVVAIPMGLLLAFPLEMQAKGVWYGFLIGLSISASLLTYRFFKVSLQRSLDAGQSTIF